MSDSTAKARPRLSVAMIVCNEQDVLAESLASVRDIADEILVLDTGSTDRTRDIAEQAGAIVAEGAWDDDFSVARNHCLGRITGDWLLWLDAGERIAPADAEQIRQFVDQQADSRLAYLVTVAMPPTVSGASGEQVGQLRLLPAGRNLQFEGRVRETVRPSVERAGLQIELAPGRIECHPRQHDANRKERLAQRNLDLIAIEAEKAVDPPARLLLAAGEACADLGRDDQAREAFRGAIDAAAPGSTEMLEAYYGLMTAYDTGEEHTNDQVDACLEALEVYPLDGQLLLAMGNYMLDQQRTEVAIKAFRAAVELGQVNLEAWHLAELADVAASCLALTLDSAGQPEQSRAVLEAALRTRPHSARIRRQLIDAHIQQGRRDAALEVVRGLVISAEDRPAMADVVHGACHAVARQWTAALGHLRKAYQAGCRDPLCLRWLTVVLVSTGEIEAAAIVLDQWEKADPRSTETLVYRGLVQENAKTAGEPPTEGVSSKAPPTPESKLPARVDAGTPDEILPPRLPIVSQHTSADRASL